MTPDLLQDATGCNVINARIFADPLTAAMATYNIDTPKRQAAFLAQIAHETCRFVFLHELWGPTPRQLTYEGRADLGNNVPGDGYRYRGRGLIQITGRANYAAVTMALDHDFLSNPDDLAQPDWAAMSAAWFWAAHGLNPLADQGLFEAITRGINGGLTGLADRKALWSLSKAALGVNDA